MAVSLDRNFFKSMSVLGYNFGLHLLKSVLPRSKKDQAKIFIEYFREDNITSFTPEEEKNIFSFEACVNCGICPAHCRVSQMSGGKFLGPEHIAVCSSRSQPEFFADARSVFRCAVCGQCEPVCPEHVPVSRAAMHMKSMIRRTSPESVPEGARKAEENLKKFGNIFGEPQVKGLPKNEKAEYILFLGCRERKDPERLKTLMALLEKLRITATCIDEVCCGGVPGTMGIEYESDLADRILSAGPSRLIASCPHCARTLKANDALADKINVMHIIEVVKEKIPEGLRAEGVEGPVAYHDPCHLGRGSGIMEEPRDILKGMGLELVEMNRNGIEAPCCGAGGGLAFIDPGLAQDVARARIEEALACGAKTLVTECMGCYHNFKSVLKDDKEIKIDLISDILARQ